MFAFSVILLILLVGAILFLAGLSIHFIRKNEELVRFLQTVVQEGQENHMVYRVAEAQARFKTIEVPAYRIN